MTFPVLPTNGPSGYNLTKSLRFRASANAYLNRTPASAGNRQRWTWSGWVKRGNFAGTICLFAGSDNIASGDAVFINTSDQLSYFQGGVATVRASTAVYRDPSAWYHFVFVSDTSNATAQNRFRMYVNGVEITAWTTNLTITQNRDGFINFNSLQTIGNNTGAAQYFDGYMAEVNFIDGQALTPSSFGSTNAITGVWQPARYTGTYGTNGFYLPFTNTTSTTTLGNDFSGNGNNWTTNNISLTPGATYDAMTDVPTLTSATAANYCVLNPLYSTSLNGGSILNGNLDLNCLSGGATSLGQATIHSTSGKYYFEVTGTTNGGFGQVLIAIQTLSNGTLTAYVKWMGTGGDTGYTTYGTYGVAYDVNAGKMWIKDTTGAWTSGDPTTGASPLYTFTANIETYPYAGSSRSSGSNNPGLGSYNFGQRPFAYTPPSGFVALNTFNLPSSTIPNGAAYMAATLYTGTSASQAISNAVGSTSFQPDFVWYKDRSNARDHGLFDSVRGVTNYLASNLTNAEQTVSGVTAFDAAGFTLGGSVNSNNSGETYVGWQWKANGAGVTNTAGSITSTVSANTTSGFSVVTYTGTGSAATVGHGLNVAPAMIIVKNRVDGAASWMVYHASVTVGATPAKDCYLVLNATSAAGAANLWNSVAPTSSTFSVSNNFQSNGSSQGMVAYCFASIAGFSAFGSYTGNGSTDGPFIYTGFRPRFVMIKGAVGVTSNWLLQDSARDTYNPEVYLLNPNTSDAEPTSSAYAVDFTANGFKIRNATTAWNYSGATFIYACFAENPFKNALAR